MSSALLRVLLALILFTITLQKSGGQLEEWCIADPQTPDDELQNAINWACKQVGVDCSKVTENQPCYLPNTVKDHASYVFNDYYQKFKNKRGTCYFRAAAMVTALDPSHDSCKFEYVP